jgi:hypothetical protein
MRARKNILVALLLSVSAIVWGQKLTPNQQEIQLLADNVFNLSEVMLHDVAAPVTASRFYAYALLGAYEATHFATGRLPNINERLNMNPEIKTPAVPKNFNVCLRDRCLKKSKTS